MSKLVKKIIALGLTISLVSVPTLREVSKANEISKIQNESFLLLSTEIDQAIQNLKVDQLSMDDFALTTLEQPDIENIKGMEDEDLPKHQQTMREYAEEYLKDIKPELINLNESSILVSEYMILYNDYFVNEIQNIQENESGEQEIRQNIEAGLKDLNAIIEKEACTVKRTQERVEKFHINLERDHKEFETSITNAGEFLIEQEYMTEEEIRELHESLDELYSGQRKQNRESIRVGTLVSSIVDEPIDLLSGKKVNLLLIEDEQPRIPLKLIFHLMTFFGMLGWAFLEIIKATSPNEETVQEKQHYNTGLIIQHQSSEIDQITGDVVASFVDFTHAWNESQKSIQTIMDKVVSGDDLNTLKPHFEESSVSWQNTKDVANIYQYLEENIPIDSVEIDLGEVEMEEDLEEALQEALDIDEFIDTSKLTDEELEEFLLDHLEGYRQGF